MIKGIIRKETFDVILLKLEWRSETIECELECVTLLYLYFLVNRIYFDI
ncbi:unnamed protein product [Coffea canephora]|uniref:Uncharacterized protein n=1 Tax=Coffea canephora TaxID=49390 RepID=A0A068V6D8_COFCA|nr:unnamed protein product [Coffea canephora]